MFASTLLRVRSGSEHLASTMTSSPCSKHYCKTYLTVRCCHDSQSLQSHHLGLAAKVPIMWSPQSKILKILVLLYFPPEVIFGATENIVTPAHTPAVTVPLFSLYRKCELSFRSGSQGPSQEESEVKQLKSGLKTNCGQSAGPKSVV